MSRRFMAAGQERCEDDGTDRKKKEGRKEGGKEGRAC